MHVKQLNPVDRLRRITEVSISGTKDRTKEKYLLALLCPWLLLEFEIILFKIKGGDVAVVDFLFKINDNHILISDFSIVLIVFKTAIHG